ncbi:MAG: ABC transporter ATP-binding protein [Desulfobacterales bacterium]|nr:ABC transporter ATP-binding protein [Desulfobacterales bacterium]
MTLEIKNLSHSYDGFHLAVDLTVEKGEFLSVIGPSGCGKSTLLRMVAGLEPHHGGEIVLNGKRLTRLSPEKRGVGLVFQDYALFPHMSVAQNIAYGLKLQRQKKEAIKGRVDELLAMVHLSSKAKALPETLSGGEQQRVALARAIAPGPSVLLLDEPLSALDARLRVDLRRQLREIHDALGLTTVYVTHDQEEALSLSDRIAVMKEGRLLQVGTPESLYEEPDNLFTGRFLGASNLLEGCVEKGIFFCGEQTVCPVEGKGKGTLFFRPQDVAFGSSVSGVGGKVRWIEYFGGWVLLHVDCAWGQVIVYSDMKHGVRVGDRIDLSLKRTRFFSA